jgi:hypothetical protein
MIVRERTDSFLLIRQHDHGLISGEFANRWTGRPGPPGSALYAIANHDIGWRELDGAVCWNEEENRPHSFTDHPLEPKLRAYREGLDLLESRERYAACLCSMHYARFVEGAESEAAVRFREDELRRQERLKDGMSVEEVESFEPNFRLLQVCDNLSLFVCLNEPGENEHPWYRDGIGFGEARFEPVWEDERVLRLEPDPFSEPFGVSIPYRLVGKDRRHLGSGRIELQVTC